MEDQTTDDTYDWKDQLDEKPQNDIFHLSLTHESSPKFATDYGFSGCDSSKDPALRPNSLAPGIRYKHVVLPVRKIEKTLTSSKSINSYRLNT